MDISIVVEGFRGVRRAEIELAPIALVGGPNEAGKTSLAQAVAACLTGNAIPLMTMRDGRPRAAITKTDAAALVRRGAETGSAKVSTEHGEARVTWPDCVVSTDGRPVDGSVWATGLAAFAEISPTERAGVLLELLPALPTRDHLTVALSGVLSQDKVDRLWSTIETAGWDGAYDKARERGQQMKGQWREVTGEVWGAKKATNWRPSGWSDDLADRSVDLLLAEVVAANKALDQAMGEQAVSEADARRTREFAAGADAAKAEADAAQVVGEQAQAEYDAALKARAQAIEVTGDSGLPCPWCSQNVRVGRGSSGEMRLERFELAIDRDEHTRLHRELVALDRRLETARNAAAAANNNYAKATQRAEICRQAAKDVAEFAADVARAKAIAEARDALGDAEVRETASRTWHRAKQLSGEIETNATIVSLLAPEGLRQVHLAAALADFNARLAEVAIMADWPAPAIGEDMAIRRGKEPYALLSRSAQWRCNVLLQVGLAEIDGSEMLIIDGIDILDRDGREGLFAMLEELGKPTLATATYSNPRSMPDLEVAGVGKSYWLWDAVLLPLNLAPPAEEVAA